VQDDFTLMGGIENHYKYLRPVLDAVLLANVYKWYSCR